MGAYLSVDGGGVRGRREKGFPGIVLSRSLFILYLSASIQHSSSSLWDDTYRGEIALRLLLYRLE